MFDSKQLNIIEYASEEVYRQRDHAKAVYWLVNAFDWAIRNYFKTDLSVENVLKIGALVRPPTNGGGFRTENVWIGGRKGPSPMSVPHLMNEWESKLEDEASMIEWARGFAKEQMKESVVSAYGSRDVYHTAPVVNINYIKDLPSAAYFAFQHIHPFGDGNGRTGKVIFNWLNGTLVEPEFPQNFWGIENP